VEILRRTKILLRGMNTRLSKKDSDPTVLPPPPCRIRFSPHDILYAAIRELERKID